jgi:hypothetical protein
MELEVDGWIQQLIECKQLSEADVKKLCDKVRRTFLYIVDNGPPLFPLVLSSSRLVPALMVFTDTRDSDGGIERTASKMSCYRLRRHPWPIRE